VTRRRGGVAAASLALSALAACSSSTTRPAPPTSVAAPLPGPMAPSPSSPSVTAASTTSVVTTTAQGTPSPIAQVQIGSSAVIVTLATRVDNLGGRIQGATLASTTFRATLHDVLSGTGTAVTTTAPSGLVSSASATQQGNDLELTVGFRQPVSSFSSAVGAGQTVQFAFRSS